MIPIGTLAALCLSAPGLIFVLAFMAMSRIRRQLRSDPLLVLASLVVGSVVAGLIALKLLHITSVTPALSDAMAAANSLSSGKNIEVSLDTIVSYALIYLISSSILAGILGATLSKLISWGWIKTDFYHGPLYPYKSGFFRKQIFVRVLSNIRISDDKYVIYSGVLEDMQMSSSGRIDYVSLQFPSKGVFGLIDSRNIDGIYRTSPGTISGLFRIEPGSESTSLGTIILESEDIQNIFIYNVDLQPAPIKTFILNHAGFIVISTLLIAMIALGMLAS